MLKSSSLGKYFGLHPDVDSANCYLAPFHEGVEDREALRMFLLLFDPLSQGQGELGDIVQEVIRVFKVIKDREDREAQDAVKDLKEDSECEESDEEEEDLEEEEEDSE